MTDFLQDVAPDLDFIRDEAEQRNGPSAGFHLECGFAWSVHSSQKVGPGGWKGPHGCPPDESAARERWGR